MTQPTPDPAHARLRALFDEALQRPPAERDDFVEAAFSGRSKPGDDSLRERLEAMLASALEEDLFLAGPGRDRGAEVPSPLVRMSAQTSSPDGLIGTSIGPYRIVEGIGEGGFGDVFRAEQEEPVKRSVALKIIKLGMDTRQVVARFDQERQALARMDHPNIARVIDAGSTETGRPFFVMELVDGLAISDYCDAHALGIDERLELFAQVCTAVQHAHGKGIIHRDLKPSNILVSEQDGRPQVKVIDFGIAKAIGGSITDHSIMTQDQQVLGTIKYMSPEQSEGSLDIDTRTDVYSLGVLLYELLTGSTPLDERTLKSGMIDELWRMIREIDPPRPSTRLHESSDTLASVAAQRSLQPHRLRTVIRGELDWITMKALEKDRTRRYETASSLALDIRSYLSGNAVVAVPPSAAYRLRKFASRNKGTVTAVIAIGMALTAGIAIALYQRDEAVKNFELAESRRKQTVALSDALEVERASLESEIKSVKRLSALQDFTDLMSRADSLWPPYPEQIPAYEKWLLEASALTESLPQLKKTRDALREMSLAPTDEEREAARREHPSFPRFEALPAIIKFKRTALLQRRDGVTAPPFTQKSDSLPSDASTLEALVWSTDPGERQARAMGQLAWSLVNPERLAPGREDEGLALALRALDLADGAGQRELRAELLHTLSRALFSLGRDDEALAASREALDLAADDERTEYKAHLAELEGWVKKERSMEGLDAAAAELAALEAELAALYEELNQRERWRFEDSKEGREARWWHANLSKLITSIEELNHAESGLLSRAPAASSKLYGWSIPRRLAFAKQLEAKLAAGGDWWERWNAARTAIRAHPAYGDLDLPVQVGLVPLGPDPSSGLWEFWHVASGAEPVRGENRELKLEEEIGLVFVLVPAGDFWMGASQDPATEHNLDPQARSYEFPVHPVSLSAYFLSKFEMTQAQWKRVTGDNPSYYSPPFDLTPTLMHPVENVTWNVFRRELGRMGLDLPSEAQWENACRAGTETPWWTGQDRESLRTANAINIADQAAAREGVTWTAIKDWAELDDGFAIHAPVGTYAPNPWGFYEMHGNLWEVCRDGYEPDFYSRGPYRDPAAPTAGNGNIVARGGCFNSVSELTRSSYRLIHIKTHASDNFGVRPVRSVCD